MEPSPVSGVTTLTRLVSPPVGSLTAEDATTVSASTDASGGGP
jgi:hypothetical protein